MSTPLIRLPSGDYISTESVVAIRKIENRAFVDLKSGAIIPHIFDSTDERDAFVDSLADKINGEGSSK